MYRRQFLQSLHAMGASIILPASKLDDGGLSDITPTNMPVLVAPGNAIAVAASAWAIPKVGIVAIGGLGSAILNDIEERLPYVGRSIAIDTDVRSLRRVKADRKIRVSDDRDLPRDHHGVRLLAQSSISSTSSWATKAIALSASDQVTVPRPQRLRRLIILC